MGKVNQNNRIINSGSMLKIYSSSLEQKKNESEYFLDVLNDLKTRTIGDSTKSLKVARFVQEFHYLQRTIKRLLSETRNLHTDMAHETKELAQLNKETYQNFLYLKEEMEDLENSFKEHKYLFRSFVSDFDYVHKNLA
ncbi:MAG: hypothetical protein NXI00_11485 [Cytophagales bacterium]|nr:hypothetical protein [Cytophagales bacterium]